MEVQTRTSGYSLLVGCLLIKNFIDNAKRQSRPRNYRARTSYSSTDKAVLFTGGEYGYKVDFFISDSDRVGVDIWDGSI